MAIDPSIPNSPGRWLQRLEAELVARRDGKGWGILDWNRKAGQRPPLKLLDAHYRGDPPLPRDSNKWAKGMFEFMRSSRVNVAPLIVDSKAQKMVPIGFRTSADSDRNGDSDAARIFKANQMDKGCAQLFRWMLTFGQSYLIVGPPAEDAPPGFEDIPLITPEHPFEVITAEDSRSRRPRAALKLFKDSYDDTEYAYVFTPGRCDVAVRKVGKRGMENWDWDEELSSVYPDDKKDIVPVRLFENVEGLGEFEPHIGALDRLNNTIFERVVIAKYQAFRQRAIIGDTEDGTDDMDDEEASETLANLFSADPGTLWKVPEGVTFWESQPIDLSPIRMAIQDDLKMIATATATPLHLITPEAAQGSAEGAALQREGGTWAVEDRRRSAHYALAEIMSMGFRFIDDDSRNDLTQFETVWAPAERYGLGEQFDAYQKGIASNLPAAYLNQRVLQETPEVQEWIDDLRETEQQQNLLFSAPTPAETTAANQIAGQAQQPAGASGPSGATGPGASGPTAVTGATGPTKAA